MEEKEETETNYFVLPDFMIVMNEIYNNPGSTSATIREATGIAYSHILGIKSELVKKGWIELRREGVRKFITLTPKGESISKRLQELVTDMGMSIKNMEGYKVKKNREVVNTYPGVKGAEEGELTTEEKEVVEERIEEMKEGKVISGSDLLKRLREKEK